MSANDLDDPFLCETQPEDRNDLMEQAPEKPEWTDEQLEEFRTRCEEKLREMLEQAPW